MSDCEKRSGETKSVGIPVAGYGLHMCVDLTARTHVRMHRHTHGWLFRASALSFRKSLNSFHRPSKASPIRQRYLLPALRARKPGLFCLHPLSRPFPFHRASSLWRV